MKKIITVFLILILPLAIEAAKSSPLAAPVAQYGLPVFLILLFLALLFAPNDPHSPALISYLCVIFIGIIVAAFLKNTPPSPDLTATRYSQIHSHPLKNNAIL